MTVVMTMKNNDGCDDNDYGCSAVNNDDDDEW